MLVSIILSHVLQDSFRQGWLPLRMEGLGNVECVSMSLRFGGRLYATRNLFSRNLLLSGVGRRNVLADCRYLETLVL